MTLGARLKGQGELSDLDLQRLYDTGLELKKHQRETFNSTFDGVEGLNRG